MSQEKESFDSAYDFEFDGRVYEGEDMLKRLQAHKVGNDELVKAMVSHVQFFKWPDTRTISCRIGIVDSSFSLYGEYVPNRVEFPADQKFAVNAFRATIGKFREINAYLSQRNHMALRYTFSEKGPSV